MRQLCIRNSAVASYSYVVYLTVALLVLGALWGVWSCSPNSSVKLVTLNKVGQLGQPGLRHQQHVLEHPALAAVSKKVNCTAALRSEEQYRLADLPLLQYSDTGGKPLLLHNHSWAIMNWITTDPGERKVHDIFRHLFSKGTLMLPSCMLAGMLCRDNSGLSQSGLQQTSLCVARWHVLSQQHNT